MGRDPTPHVTSLLLLALPPILLSSLWQRRAGITLPLSELPAVMRALGFYPTAAEVAALNNEARAIHALEGAAAAASRGGTAAAAQQLRARQQQTPEAALEAYTGGWSVAAPLSSSSSSAATAASSGESVTLPTLLRLYVNHRPVLPLGRDSVLRSVGAIAGLGDEIGNGPDVRWGALTKLLASRAEAIDAPELLACLTALMGPLGPGPGFGAPPPTQHIGDDELLSGEEVAERVLAMA